MSNNVFNYIYDYIPPKEVTHQEHNNLINGGNMEGNLKEYRLFLGMKYSRTNTQIVYYNAAKKYLDYITEISKEQTQRYIAHLNQTHRPNSVTTHIVGLNRYFEYLQRPDLRVPTPDWKPVNRDIIKREQIMQLIEHARKHYHYMDYLILLMVRDLDCRNHEIIKTRWDWIHGDKIHFQDCKTGDTTGRLTPELKEALETWRKLTPYPDEPYVFLVPHGPFKGQTMGHAGWYIRSLINRISIEVIGRRLNPQDLRASVITAEYTAYVNPKVIQLKARHRSEKTTMRYNHVDEEMVAEYIETGTIFTNNKGPISPISRPEHKNADNKKSKRGYINLFSSQEPSETEDNTEFSFSYSLSFYENHVEDLIGSMVDEYQRLGWSEHRNRGILP